jgi:hypothetical protein
MAETSTIKLNEKAPMSDWTLPRNRARSTTPTIAGRSSCGLYHAASPPPAAIKAASLSVTRLSLLKLIEIIHLSVDSPSWRGRRYRCPSRKLITPASPTSPRPASHGRFRRAAGRDKQLPDTARRRNAHRKSPSSSTGRRAYGKPIAIPALGALSCRLGRAPVAQDGPSLDDSESLHPVR